MTITAIIIDDERKSIVNLKHKIERFFPQINIIAEAQSPFEGIKLIENLNPQLVFLDIAMPKINGLELLDKTKNLSFEIIFVTAYDHYAIDAIKHCAIGYLVKPVDNDDLILAISNAIKNIKDKTALQKNTLLIENTKIKSFQDKKVVIATQEGLEFAKINEILHCKGVNGYTKIYFKSKKTILSSLNIGHFTQLLENQEFYLVHKSHLINLNHITKYLNEGTVILTNDHKIPVSRNRKNSFITLIRA